MPKIHLDKNNWSTLMPMMIVHKIISIILNFFIRTRFKNIFKFPFILIKVLIPNRFRPNENRTFVITQNNPIAIKTSNENELLPREHWSTDNNLLIENRKFNKTFDIN